MYRVSGISIMVAGLWLMLGAGPGWAGPPDIVISDAKGNTAGGTGALFSNTTGHDSPKSLQGSSFGSMSIE
jgi:hypothetical protein